MHSAHIENCTQAWIRLCATSAGLMLKYWEVQVRCILNLVSLKISQQHSVPKSLLVL